MVDVGEFQASRFDRTMVLALRHVGRYEEVDPTWIKLIGFAQTQGVLGPNTIQVGIVYDDPTLTPAERIRYDACLSVSESQAKALGPAIKGTDLRLDTIQGGDAIVTVHQGPFSELINTYTNMQQHSAFATGRTARQAAPYYEVYKTNPGVTHPSELVTEIYFPSAQPVTA